MFSGRNSRSLRPVIRRAAILASGTPVAFETYGTVREARGFTSITYTLSALDGVLHVHQADDIQSARQLERVIARIVFEQVLAECRPQAARRTSRRSGCPPLRCAA